MAETSQTLKFCGAAGTVTGSKYFLNLKGRQILLDAGLFQGLKELRLRNWSKPPFDPAQIEAVVLSHAHIDHSGYLPVLVREEFKGKVYCTSATEDLLGILLPDSAKLQEEGAAFANKKGFSKHKPALPLYTLDEVRRTLNKTAAQPFGKMFEVTDSVQAVFRRAGHILGAATVELQIARQKSPEPFRLVFSGDLGRWNQPILHDPEMVPEADLLILESTYGDKNHPKDAGEKLAEIIRAGVERGGAILIPAFAVGRTQELVWMIRKLEEEKKIPAVPVYVDSPMALRTTEVYARHPEEHDLETQALRNPLSGPLSSRLYHLVETPEESKRINHIRGPVIIIASSGMATGGRVLHHLFQRLPDPRTTVVLAGYQAEGTRGRSLQDRAKTLRMFGQQVAVNARVETVEGLSAHADQENILRWLGGFKRPPKQTFLVHGEPRAAAGLAEKIKTVLGWKVSIAQDGQSIELPVEA